MDYTDAYLGESKLVQEKEKEITVCTNTTAYLYSTSGHVFNTKTEYEEYYIKLRNEKL